MQCARRGLAGIVAIAALLMTVGGCSSPGPSLSGPPSSVAGTVTAGPVCPVERNPPESACAPRPVAGAVVVVADAQGHEVARATSDPSGAYTVAVGLAGTFTVSGLPVAGLLGLPGPVTVTLGSAVGVVATANLEYDTGIR